MTGVDTNMFVRFLTRDDENQFNKAVALIERESVFIPDTVWLETEWVLRYAYNFASAAVTKPIHAPWRLSTLLMPHRCTAPREPFVL